MKITFLAQYFIRDPIFKIFASLFKIFGLQKNGIFMFLLKCFRKVSFWKRQFLKDGVRIVFSQNDVSA